MTDETINKSSDRTINFYLCSSIAMCLVFTLLVSVASSQDSSPQPGKPLFEPSVAANHIVEPLDANGDVDYEAYINQESSKGVTPENNAMVKIVEALGPQPDGQTVPDRFYEHLGSDPPPERDDYFVEFNDWFLDSDFSAEHKDPQSRSDLVWDYALEHSWDAGDFPEMAAYIKTQERTIQLTLEAVARPKYYYPMVTQEPGGMLLAVLLPHIQESRNLARLLTLRSNQRLGSGNIAGAIEDASAVVKLGESMTGNGDTLVVELVALAIRGIGYRQLARILRDPQTDVQDLQRLDNVVASFKLSNAMPKTIVSRDRLVALDGVKSLFRSKNDDKEGALSGFFKIDVRGQTAEIAMLTLNQQFDQVSELLDQLQADPNFDFEEAMEIIWRNIKVDREKWVITRRARSVQSGKALAELLLPPVAQVLNVEARLNSELKMLRLMIDLEQEKAESGSYPKQLSDLAPDWLPEVPKDPFSRGSEYVYKLTKEGYRLYSIGPNKIDDGGPENLNWRADDWQIEIEASQSWEEFQEENAEENEDEFLPLGETS